MDQGILRRLGIILAVGVAALTLHVTEAAAQPSTLTQQGRLFDQATGDPVHGTETVTFSIYDAENAATSLWSEMHVLDFDDGYFHAELGGASPFDGVFDTDPGEERWIGVVIDGAELLPRQKVGMVPYARRALEAHDVVGEINPEAVNIDGHGPVIDDEGRWVGAPVVTAAGGGYDFGVGLNADSGTFVGNTLQDYGNTPISVEPAHRVLVFASAFPRRTGDGSMSGYVVPCAIPEGGGTPIVPPAYQGWSYFTATSSASFDLQLTSMYTFTNLTAGAYYFTVCGNSYTGEIQFRGPQVRALRF
jgi:hypothetical protein